MSTRRVVLPLALLLALVLLAPAGVLASTRGGAGGDRIVVVHRGFFHDPFWYGGWYGPYWYGYPYGYDHDNMGTVKVKVTPNDGSNAQLFINGALNNSFKGKDSVYLKPGEYTVEVRKPGYESRAQSVYVTAGKTVKLEFNLERTS